MKHPHFDEIKAIIIFACALILLTSLVSFVPEDLPWFVSNPNTQVKNLISVFGAYVSGAFFFVFGYSSYFLVIFLLFLAWEKFYSREIRLSYSKLVSLGIMFCVLSSLFSMVGSQVQADRFQRSGVTGLVISDFLVKYFGHAGAYIILITLGMLALILIGEFLISPFLFRASRGLKGLLELIKIKAKERKEKIPTPITSPIIQEKLAPQISEKITRLKNKISKPLRFKGAQERVSSSPSVDKQHQKPHIRISEPKEEPAIIKQDKPKIVGEYHMPPLNLLNDPPSISSRKIQGDLMDGAKTLESTLADFGVSARVADIKRGPVITRYELESAPGVKVQRITTLSDDIALAMRAQSVRIVAPIPGKNRVGIEVPNTSSSLVYLKDIVSQNEFINTKSKLTLALGKDIAGKSLIANLADMPHLLIAGTTGSGKTVCLNSVIMSMLFRATPDEVKFLFVDPKMVELSIYNELPHALCPAVTDPKKVSAALNWVVGEMESRYSILAKERVRNITEHNKMGDRLPYIVVIVDELADLMQIAAKQIESAITRLAQLSRAVGIHLILATQRPSVDVITGVVKANFPARISFKVASKVDSRTVLDMNGAESLLGKGDMLFLKPGDAKPTRAQCSLVSDDEIQKVINFIKTQQSPVYDDTILQKQKTSTSGVRDEKDELYDEALQLVIETNQASVSILQRRMRLGYTRAARLIDMMEQEGVVGPYCGSKPREILVDREEWLMRNMDKNN